MTEDLTPRVFREVNERIAEITSRWEWEDKQGFLCECAAGTCTHAIWLSRPEYEAIRAEPSHFFAVAGHEQAGEERVVERMDGYVVVERLTDVGEAAEDDERTA